ncbi:GNAT family N-acetyltransferase [Nisaea sediminum]|uniref:GNAT family N-acetyltransferase n=1 Tax=Nisaea sediminum TaxID=2775867 RepID=UPI0018678376|nr:N-acetyltransferase [Nisaea sediminum]
MAGPGIEIRESGQADVPAIEALYPAAFPEEDLLPLLRDLALETSGVFSLVALEDGDLVGHIAFTTCDIEGQRETPALLGPLAVSPSRQRRGIGSALVRAGLEKLAAGGVRKVLVLGDPRYYSRFGFTAEKNISPPYTLPEGWAEAWQSMVLGSAPLRLTGTLAVPRPWRVPAYWGA